MSTQELASKSVRNDQYCMSKPHTLSFPTSEEGKCACGCAGYDGIIKSYRHTCGFCKLPVSETFCLMKVSYQETLSVFTNIHGWFYRMFNESGKRLSFGLLKVFDFLLLPVDGQGGQYTFTEEFCRPDAFQDSFVVDHVVDTVFRIAGEFTVPNLRPLTRVFRFRFGTIDKPLIYGVFFDPKRTFRGKQILLEGLEGFNSKHPLLWVSVYHVSRRSVFLTRMKLCLMIVALFEVKWERGKHVVRWRNDMSLDLIELYLNWLQVLTYRPGSVRLLSGLCPNKFPDITYDKDADEGYYTRLGWFSGESATNLPG